MWVEGRSGGDATPRLRDQRMFLRFWMARVTTTAAAQMLSLAMGWQMYELTRNAWDLGLIGLAQFIPAFLVSLPAGQAADRFHRGRLLAVCIALQAAAAALLLVASWQGLTTRELLLLAACLLGLGRGVQMPAQQAMVPALVPRTLLSRAMAVNASAAQLAIASGPAAGGLLLLRGPLFAHATCLGLLLAGLALAVGLRYTRTVSAVEPMTLASVFAGARFVWERKVLLAALSLDLLAVLLGGATALLPMFAVEVLRTGPAGLGLLRAAPAVGALAMAAVLARAGLSRNIGSKLMAAVTVYALAMGVFGLSGQMWLSLAALAVSGSADMVSAVVRQTLVQAETPDAMRGRVAAVNAVFMGASNQLGEFESGATAAAMGPVGSVLFGSLATLCVVVAWLRLFPDLLRRDRFDDVPPTIKESPT
jgi:MFS family permease